MSGWRTDAAPRGVRCLVTSGDGHGGRRLSVASISPDSEPEAWYSDGRPLVKVIAWMPCPAPAEPTEPTELGANPRPTESRLSVSVALTSSAHFLESLLAEGVEGQRIRLQAALEGVQRASAFLGQTEADLAAAVTAQPQCPGCGANQTDERGACCWCGTVYRAAPGRHASIPIPSANDAALAISHPGRAARAFAGAEAARLRARWAASLPFVEAVVSLWNETLSDEGAPIRHKFDRRWVRAMLDAAIGALGQLAHTLTDVELADLPEVVTLALRGGVDADASLAKTREWTMTTAEMKKAEADLDAIDKRGSVLVAELLRMRRENPDAYPREDSPEPDISDEEIEVRHAAACTTGDERTRMLCEIATGDRKIARRIARAALATRSKP